MDHYTPFNVGDGSEKSSDELPEGVEVDQALPDAVTDEDEPSRVEYLKNMLPLPLTEQRSKHRHKWPLWILLTVIIVTLMGGGYWFATRNKYNSPTPVVHKSAPRIVAPAAGSSTGTTHYISNGNDLNLDFDYPSGWAVSPASNNNSNDQTVTVTSPLTTIVSADGTSDTGKIVVSIRPGTADLSELNASTTAAQASVQFAYSKPTSAQFQYPYLAFVHTPSDSSVASSFNEVLVAGTTPFSQGSGLTSSDIQVDPIIGAGFYACTTQTCSGSGAKPVSITDDTWQNTAVFQQALAIFQSMQLN